MAAAAAAAATSQLASSGGIARRGVGFSGNYAIFSSSNRRRHNVAFAWKNGGGDCSNAPGLISFLKMSVPSRLSAIVISSGLTFAAMPLEALAETCKEGPSFAQMPIFIAVAFVGAAVGGLLARQRREELKRVNDQLRQINIALKRQAQIESYAPSLTYAPVGKPIENEATLDPRKQQLLATLRSGKNFLRTNELEKAVVEFKAAYELAESLGDHLEEKKAARGLGASLQRLGKYRQAIKQYSKLLELSKKTGEDSGSTEAYGAIADCYAELGDIERAAKFYDKYIARLKPSD